VTIPHQHHNPGEWEHEHEPTTADVTQSALDIFQALVTICSLASEYTLHGSKLGTGTPEDMQWTIKATGVDGKTYEEGPSNSPNVLVVKFAEKLYDEHECVEVCGDRHKVGSTGPDEAWYALNT
jgi:hypothetical protein